MKAPFKTCTVCAHRWQGLQDLIRDKNIYINGYQASFRNADDGLFMVTHNVEGCGTTLAIKAGDLKALYTGPIYSQHLAGSDVCPGHCMNGDDLLPCPNDCAMSWVREILRILINHGPDELLKKLDEAEKHVQAA
ncbi:MAG: hypothetical protein JXR25_13415 [Pontiellaceae bacterium]|nr:hypothetical protein [Pontiellaceae bacterium]MBN2785814.1 hypothetical protein [Pontiellaceae bacterium]